MRQQESVLLVDESGRHLFCHDGTPHTIDKIEAHRRGLLHRAVSVFIFNDRKELLLQRRSNDKYHSPGKWTNTCCTHPLPGESLVVTAQRRLIEEMGIVAKLTEAFAFLYQADVGNNLIEYEYDHIFWGSSNLNPSPNPVEVSDWRWITLDMLEKDLVLHPEAYSSWLRYCFGDVVKYVSYIKVQNTLMISNILR